jgi:hypothetical protein
MSEGDEWFENKVGGVRCDIFAPGFLVCRS